MLRLVLLTAAALLFASPSFAQSVVFGGPSQAQVDALQSQIAAQSTKSSSIPSTGPGAGLCRETIVPSNLVSSGGIQGAAGTCSTVIQCGTSAATVVKQFNVGSGC